MDIRWGLVNITATDTVLWNIVKNLFIPFWYSDGTIDIQLIPITAIILLLVL